MSNFNFLKQPFPHLYNNASQAESLIFSNPRGSCFYSRFSLEQGVMWLYENEPYLNSPSDNNLASLIHEQTFKENLKPGLFPKLKLILKIGNQAVHDNTEIEEREALHINKELWHFLYWLTRYYTPNGKTLGKIKYNKELITPQPPLERGALERGALERGALEKKALEKEALEKKALEKEALEKRLNQEATLKQIAEKKAQQTEAELQQLKAEIEKIKQANLAVEDTHDYNEADTRKYLIDVLLKEAGWNLAEKNVIEYEVNGMPNKTGKGKIDYVLWDKNGLPLAVIEAKRNLKDAKEGKHQAKLYADCLENEFKQRPLIFYTNGYKTYFWDDLNYPPREIQGFFKQEELNRIIHRRNNKKKLNSISINQDIVNRTYQIEAIKSINQKLENKHRKALLVMATGTGKTRTAIALVDLLIRAGWVKKALFVADRNSLITQAKRAFKSHLPHSNIVNLKQIKPQDAIHANIVLSTYPTLLNRIDIIEDNKKIFSVGHFDLIIIDEAHRSIYKKYSHIFNYFDSLLIGLTATPRNEIDRDTYKIFDLPSEVPTFAYELNDAIKDGYLVPPKGIKIPFKFIHKGIKYNELSPQEKEEYEEKFRDEETEEIPSIIDATALNNWLFNIDTVDKTLQILMEKGIKIEGGDKLGKTIIFAKNHHHAKFIVERFDYNYPHLKGQFAQVIDSHNNHAQNLIDNFSDSKKEPTIAVSVDMLDTGIDIPEVVNLVFFKPIYSRVKFNQMIGRGTRLCADLLGIRQDKKEFYIFDLCSNFDFFAQEIEEKETKLSENLSTRLTKIKLKLTEHLEATNPLKKELLNNLHHQITTLEKNNFLVRPFLQEIETFSDRQKWDNLNSEDVKIINNKLASLPTTLPQEKREVKEFDLLCYKIQLTIIKNSKNFIYLRDKIRDLLHNLETKKTIPMVKKELKLIESIQNEEWWEDITVEMIEKIRIKLRNLIQFIDKREQEIIITDFKDELGELEEKDIKLNTTGFSPYQYRKKVEAYIKANQDHITINKLKKNLPLTNKDLKALETMLFSSEEIENKQQFEKVFDKQINLKKFIRELVGLDRNTAKKAFSKYLETTHFTAHQIRFVENIIDYLTQNGIMDIDLLYEAPFTDIHYEGLDGLFSDDEADNLIAIIDSFNNIVEVA